MQFISTELATLVRTPADIWVALYVLFLDYANGVPRITDANRLTPNSAWYKRAQLVEQRLAQALGISPAGVVSHVDYFMRTFYPPNTQRMNPIGIGLACAGVYLIDRFGAGHYRWQMESKIGIEVFTNLLNFRRKAVDVVAFSGNTTYAVISSKWGIRHDRLRDPQEEADTYKIHEPNLGFYVLTNEFDNGRLQHLLNWPTIDGVFHINKDLVWNAYGGNPPGLAALKDFTDLFPLFP